MTCVFYEQEESGYKELKNARAQTVRYLFDSDSVFPRQIEELRRVFFLDEPMQMEKRFEIHSLSFP